MKKRIKILGRAGCGKTTRLLEYYKSKINDNIIKANVITVVTFRKSAAIDMRNVILETYPSMSEDSLKRTVSTIHSQCYRLIGSPDLLTAQDYADFVTEKKYKAYIRIKNIEMDAGDDWEEMASMGDLFALYAWCKNTCTPPEKGFRYPNFKEIKLPRSRVPQFFKDFEKYKERIVKIDYTDMLQKVLDKRIMLDSSILIVDEFQDLTPQMYKIFDMWCTSTHISEVVIAGDPYQAIYSFFGGLPDFFINWEADEYIPLPHSYRLTNQVKDFGDLILNRQRMKPEPITAENDGGQGHITKLLYSDPYPTHGSELHLVRANFQILGLALRLANDGKVFSTLHHRKEGWMDKEMDLANAIIAIRQGFRLTIKQKLALVNYFPEKMVALPEGNLIETTKKWIPCYEIIDILKSEEPTKEMTSHSKLFIAKMHGIKNRTTLIVKEEIANRRIMTIHAGKGLEALGVFLHTGITPQIRKSIAIFCEESQAEARVFYVGATRARDHLYLVKDEGANYRLPVIPKIVLPVDAWDGIEFCDWEG
jgi:DNA helicase II / ATP-dependent DNA helicase PcrA